MQKINPHYEVVKSKLLSEAKTWLVTGVAGFIGSHLVDELVARNANSVTVVDNFFLGQEENLRSARNNSVSLNVLRLDASDLAAMTSVVRNF